MSKSGEYAKLAGSLAAVALAALGGPLPAAATAALGEVVKHALARYESSTPTRELHQKMRAAVLAWADGERIAPEHVELGLGLATRVMAQYGLTDEETARLDYNAGKAAQLVVARAAVPDRYWGTELHYQIAETAIEVTYAALYERLRDQEKTLLPAIRVLRAEVGVYGNQLAAMRRDVNLRFDTMEEQLLALRALMSKLVSSPPHATASPALAGEGTPSLVYQVERPDVESWLHKFLLPAPDSHDLHVPSRIALHGGVGVGKSVLASRVAQVEEVRSAYPDGVMWVSLQGRALVSLQLQLSRDCGFDSNFDDWPHGQQLLRQALTDLRLLLVLDGVTSQTQLDAFDVLGPGSATLFTTRDMMLATANSTALHEVGKLKADEARTLLAHAAGLDITALPPQAGEVLTHCDGLEFAIAMCGAIVRGQPGERWQALVRNLETAKLQRIAAPVPGYKEVPNLLAALDVGLDDLDSEGSKRDLPDALARYGDLVAFRGRGPFPSSTAAMIWRS